MHYDYIIAGAGCSGLSLVYHLLQDERLKSKRLLILDKDPKQQNDRTWCFWEKQDAAFEKIVHHHWDHLIFKNEKWEKKLRIAPYRYKMIRGIDFYQFIFEEIEKHPNVHFRQESILEMSVVAQTALVKTDQELYQADYVFNSTSMFLPKMNKNNTLLQHFMGWKIQSPADSFDEKVGTLMDFSLSQKHGTTFMYVLPTSKKEALVEYTLFTKDTLEEEEYEKALENYLAQNLNLISYEIVEREYGIIPMSTAPFPTHYQERVIHLGTAGGYTKASSGYTFQFVQKHCRSIVERLRNNSSPIVKATLREQMYHWYDLTLLDVLLSKKLEGKEVFSRIFKNVEANKVLAFLGNESTITEDIEVMLSLPVLPFLGSGIKMITNSYLP